MILVGDVRRPPFRIQADLIYTDPPSNRGVNEGNSDDRLSPEDFYQFSFDWLNAVMIQLRNPGWLVICTYFRTRWIYESIIRRFHSHLIFDHEVIWSYNFGVYTKKRFVPSHDNILIYRFGHPPFHWQDVAIPSQRLQVGDSRADQRGRTPGSVWQIPRVPGNDRERNYVHSHRRSCQPVELCQRIALAFTARGQIIYEPFAGTGTMAIIAHQHKRKYYGLDICTEYVKEIKNRLIKLEIY